METQGERTSTSSPETLGIVATFEHWLGLMLTTGWALLAGRVLLCAIFIVSPIQMALDFGAAEKEVRSMVSLEPTSLITLAVIGTLALGSLLVCFTRRWAWLGAGLLGGFTLVTNFVAHDFWNMTGSERMDELNVFLAHVGLIGAFVLVAAWSLAPAADRKGEVLGERSGRFRRPID